MKFNWNLNDIKMWHLNENQLTFIEISKKLLLGDECPHDAGLSIYVIEEEAQLQEQGLHLSSCLCS